MTYRGHIENGQILLHEPAPLPDGAEVTVEIVVRDRARPIPRPAPARQFQPIEMPGGSLADELIRDRR